MPRDEAAARAPRCEYRAVCARIWNAAVLFPDRTVLYEAVFGKKAESVAPNQVQLAFAPVLDALARVEAGAPLHRLMCRTSSRSSELQRNKQAKRMRVATKAKAANVTVVATSAERAPVEVIVLEPPVDPPPQSHR